VSEQQLDPRLTFEGFVVGPANRLAAASARRVADAPGATYNPLFIYGASGLGKTHLLSAIASQVRRTIPRAVLICTSLEPLADRLADAEQGPEEREHLNNARVLLLDDVQFLGPRRDMQEELLSAWDTLAARSSQIVLASDRPPNEIAGLDRRLLSRFSGGLIADIAPPTFETRAAIVRRMAADGGHHLAAGVPEVLARVGFGNVRELQGALNRILAVQEVEQRLVAAGEVGPLLGMAQSGRSDEEFNAFVSEIEGAVDELVTRHSPEQRLAEAILRWEGEGYRTTRLDESLTDRLSAQGAEELVRVFQADVARLEQVNATIRSIDPGAPELARVDVLLDPDRVREAEALLARVQERHGMPVTAPSSVQRPSPPARGRERPAGARSAPLGDVKDEWFLSREKVLWDWPALEDWLVQESS
jgi:hypothetical protein